jgi:diguanylate cyclase (GGDEF)-like protein/PAS domain S-box-containing protein
MDKILAIPDFADPARHRRANILIATQVASVTMILMIMIISYLFTPEHSEALYQGAAGIGALLLSYYLLRKGKLEAAGWVIVVAGWSILTLDLAFISGIRGVSLLGQVLIVIFAGLAIGGKSALAITIVNVSVNFLILYLEQAGILAQPDPLPANFTRWFIQSIYTGLAGIYIWRADSVILSAFRKSQSTADRYRALFECTTDGVVILDLNRRVINANHQTGAILKCPLEKLTGQVFSTWFSAENWQVVADYLDKAAQEDDYPLFENQLVCKNGQEIPVEISLALVPDSEGKPQHIQCILRDITERKQYEHQLIHQALHDPLTNLPNRTFFEERYQEAQTLQTDDQRMVAVLFIDIDDFKEVNDRFGHAVGDQVLKLLGERMLASVRTSDTVARLGGDEFLIILENISSKVDVSHVAEKIIKRISKPFRVKEHVVEITVSIGINLTQKSNLSDVDLIKTSDAALYQVKDAGKNNYRFYEPEVVG